MPFVAYFVAVLGVKALVLFAALPLAVAVYNRPGIRFKGRPVVDVLSQSVYVLEFVLSSWLNGVPQLPWQAFVLGAAFAMHAHLFGSVMNIELDRLAGQRTTAVVLGRVRSKFVIALMLAFETLWVYGVFHDPVVAGLLGCAAALFACDALLLWGHKPYTPRQAGAILMAWNVFALCSAPWVWSTGAFTHAR